MGDPFGRAGAIVQCEVDDRGVLRDVDTPADLAAPQSDPDAEPAIRRR